MMKTDTAFFFAVLSLLFLSAGASLVTVENVDVVPEGWKLHGRANTSEQISLSIALKQHKIEALKTRLDAISSPGSPNYGNHLSREDVQSQRAAEPQDVSLVRSWLAAHGVDVVLARDWMTFNTTVGNAEGLLNTKLYSYSFEDRKSVIRAHTYSVPLEISSAVDFVHPLCNFMPPSLPRLKPAPMPQRLKSTCGRPELPCNGGTDPACIRALYNINYTAPIGNSPVKFGIAGFLEQYINYEDTSTFMKRYAPEIEQTGYNFTVELVSGGENPQGKDAAGMEASLDVQYAMALGYPTNVIYYSVGGRGIELDGEGIPYHAAESDNEPFVEFLDYLLDRTDDALPDVISISYADDELSVPKAYALRTCDMFAALAARGVSVLVASGDGGSRGTGQRLCYSNDGRGREMTLPTFPASCPYVTTVGATTNSGPPVTGAGFSTGGFSNYFRRPEWQSDAVAEYIAALNGTLKGRYNPSGRAYPDISAIGSGFAIEWGGTSSSVLGTSASCPVVAAMVALVNDARLRAGKRPVGWLNPILYSEKMRAVLQDVVEGQSYSCSWNGDAPGGWPAKPGFDTITGLGVPNDFEKFLKVFMDLD